MGKQVRQVSQGRPAPVARAGRLTGVGRAAVAWLRAVRGRTIAWAAGALVAVGALVVAGTLLFGHDDGRPPIPDTRARHYADVDACLLTGAKGITAGAAAEVWQGMQDASLKTHARVSYQQVMGEQTTGNAQPFLNNMLQGSCDVVLAVGKPEVTAAAQSASRYGKIAFVLVGDGGGHEGGTGGKASAANVTAVPTGDGLRADVAGAVERAVAGKV